MIVGWILGLGCICPFVFLYFLIIKSTDRYEPEPFWLLTAMFFWGAVIATLSAIAGNELGIAGMSYVLGVKASDPLVSASTASFIAPPIEESTKGIGLLVLWAFSAIWFKELDGPLDGAIYGGVVGLGFTMTEDMLYVGSAAAQGGMAAFTETFLLRTVFAGLGHASFTAMTGLGVGIAAESSKGLIRWIAPIGGYLAAVGLHSLHNFLVTFLLLDGVGLVLKFAVFWTFDAVFFVVIVILALRDRSIVLRGLVDEAGRSLHPKELARTVSYWMLIPFWNLLTLAASPGGYWNSRKKQLDLIRLAFLKHRMRRGDTSADLRSREGKLRERIAEANRRGIFIGSR